MPDVTFRQARRSDLNRIVELMIGDPKQVTTQVGIKVFELKHHNQMLKLVRVISRGTRRWKYSTLAEKDGVVVGFVQTGSASMKMTPGMFWVALRFYGPSFMRVLAPRIKLQNRVQTSPHPEAFSISEIHVDPAYRGRGIGKALLEYAENNAREAGHKQISLQTWTGNPARRLYERCGYRVVKTRTDPEFEALTGTAGNHRMVKDLK